MTLSNASGNEEQIRHWNEVAGPLWVERQDVLDRMIGAFGAAAIEGARFAASDSVLDVGCGTGQTTVEIARRVGASGRVVGLDVSRPMLESARRRAAAHTAGAAPVTFVEADAQVAALERGAFDIVFSRFGVMFFSDPVAAFANLRTTLSPSGRLVFACWQGLARNPWVAGPVQTVATVLPMPQPPPPGAPGPFSLGDPDRLRDVLGRAGFRGIELLELRETLVVGDGSVESTLEFLLHIGPCATLLKDAPPETTAAAVGALRSFFASLSRDGVVRLAGAAWQVRALP